MGKKKKHGEGKGGCIYNINNWRSKIFFLWKRRNTEKKKEENIWRRNIFSSGNGGLMGAQSHAMRCALSIKNPNFISPQESKSF